MSSPPPTRIVLHELTRAGASLEQIFLELTSDGWIVINQIRAEVLKIRSTRTTLGFVAGTVVLVVAITLLTGLLSDSLHTVEDQRQLFGLGGIAGPVLGACGHPRDHRRVPLRHDPPDLSGLARAGRGSWAPRWWPA